MTDIIGSPFISSVSPARIFIGDHEITGHLTGDVRFEPDPAEADAYNAFPLPAEPLTLTLKVDTSAFRAAMAPVRSTFSAIARIVAHCRAIVLPALMRSAAILDLYGPRHRSRRAWARRVAKAHRAHQPAKCARCNPRGNPPKSFFAR